MKQLIRNSMITPDGTHLISRDRHDYVSHNDKNGKIYAIDGGLEYSRIVGDFQDCTNTSVYNDEPFEKIREAFAWGSYGPNGDQPKKYIVLKDMDTDHIEAILKTQSHISKVIRKIFQTELDDYRKGK